MQIVLATHNKDKIKEIKNLLGDLPVEIKTFEDFPDMPDVEETGTTLEENALLKSNAINDFTGLTALADDTGLEVDALDGRPGVYSARYAGPGCSYEDNCNKMLEELDGVSIERRNASFRTVIAITWDKDNVKTVEGRADGIITTSKQGESGFGYDPVFYYPPAGKTFAEMTLDEKNKVSHRGLALLKAKELIKHYLENHPG